MKLLFAFCFLLANTVFAQLALPPAAAWESNAGKLAAFDFNIPMEGITDPSLNLSQFKGKPLMVFYFSAKCPHCMKAYPRLETMAQEYFAKGLNVIAVAVGGNRKPDIRVFIENQRVKVPVLQDTRRILGKKYGVGTVPLVLIINEKGNYIRYRSFDREINDMAIELGNLFPKN